MAATRRQTKGGLKASGIIYLLIGIVCVVIGVITLLSNFGYMVKGETKDLQTYVEKGGPIPEGEYYSFEIKSAFGPYAELKHTTNGIPTGTDKFYVLWLDNDYLISFKIKNKSDIKTMDKIAEETANSDSGYSTTTLKVSGKMNHVTDKEQLKYYRDFLDGASDSGFDVRELELDVTDSRGSLWGLFALFCGLGVLLILVALATLKKAKNFDNAPAVDYSNVDYTPVDTTAYNPVDTSAPYDPTGADLNGSSDANLNNTDPGMTLNGGQDPNNFQ